MQKNSTLLYLLFFFFLNLYLNHPFSNECMFFFACMCVLHACGSSFIFLCASPARSDIILIKTKHRSPCVDADKDQPCLSVAFPRCFSLLSHFIPSLIVSDKRPRVASVVMKPVLEEQHRWAFRAPHTSEKAERRVHIDLILFP